MALYKYSQELSPSQDAAFDAIHHPGNTAPFAGVYRCAGCGHEIGIAEGHVLPPQDHPQHPPGLGPIKWKLLVFAKHNK